MSTKTHTGRTVLHDKEKNIKAFGLTAVAVNSTAKSEMDAEERNIWKHVESETTVILVSPEMLSTSGFGSLITWNCYTRRVY
jgi:superfamily II DNA helicase RecQ